MLSICHCTYVALVRSIISCTHLAGQEVLELSDWGGYAMSQTQDLRDRNNRKLGEIRTDSNGRQTLYNANNKRLGEYNPKTNETRDANNRLVGKGNLLGSLLS